MNLFQLSILGVIVLCSSEGPSLVSAQAAEVEICENYVCCLDCECCSFGTAFDGQRCVVADPVTAGSCPQREDVCVNPKCVEGECCGPDTLYDAPNCRCFSPGGLALALALPCNCTNIVIEQNYSIAQSDFENLETDENGLKTMCAQGRLDVTTVISSRNCTCLSNTCSGWKNVDITAEVELFGLYWPGFDPFTVRISDSIPCEKGSHQISAEIPSIYIYGPSDGPTRYDIKVELEDTTPCTLQEVLKSRVHQISSPFQAWPPDRWIIDAPGVLNELRPITVPGSNSLYYDLMRLIDENNPAWPACPWRDRGENYDPRTWWISPTSPFQSPTSPVSSPTSPAYSPTSPA